MPDLDALLGTPEPDTLVYTCGPSRTPRRGRGAVRDRGRPAPCTWSGSRPRPPTTTGRHRVRARSPALRPDPDSACDKSVFDVCKAAGVSVVGSCLEGICGTCETEVVDGEVDHRDSILNEDEQAANEFMMICVSRCRSDHLTLDL